MSKLTQIEKDILEKRQVEGKTEKNTMEELKIGYTKYKKIVSHLIEIGEYNEEIVKQAVQKRKRKEYERRQYEKRKNQPQMSIEDRTYYKKCTDFLCFNYLDYRFTKKYDTSLTTKLNELHNKNYSFKIIYNTMLSQKNSFDYAINHKDFANDRQRIMYLMKIVESNLTTQQIKEKKYKEVHEGFNKKIDDDEITHQLNKKIVSKPSKRLDLSEFLD